MKALHLWHVGSIGCLLISFCKALNVPWSQSVCPLPCQHFLLVCLGYDVIAQAQSGTGKTATFAISILQQIELDLKATQALVLAPTRELAQQVSIIWSKIWVCSSTTTTLWELRCLPPHKTLFLHAFPESNGEAAGWSLGRWASVVAVLWTNPLAMGKDTPDWWCCSYISQGQSSCTVLSSS